MAVRKIACIIAAMLSLALAIGCTSPRPENLVLVEPSYSHHRDQPSVSREQPTAVEVGRFAGRRGDLSHVRTPFEAGAPLMRRSGDRSAH